MTLRPVGSGLNTAPPFPPVTSPPMSSTAHAPPAAPPASPGQPREKPAAVEFLSRFLRNPRTVGAVWPSGPRLAAAMLDSVDWPRAQCVLEFGPPAPARSPRHVPARLKAGGRFLAVERDPAFAARLRRELPHVDVACADISHVQGELAARDLPPADAILCGLPWAAFPPALQHELMAATVAALAPGGTFATFAYVQGTVLPAGRRLRVLLEEHFSTVTTSPGRLAERPAGSGLSVRKITPRRGRRPGEGVE